MEMDSQLRHGGNSVEYKIVSTTLQHGKLLMICQVEKADIQC